MTQVPAQPSAPQGNMTLVVVAVIVALVAVVLINLYLVSQGKERAEDEVSVFFLNRTVEPGDKLKWDDIDEKRIPRRYEDAFGKAVRDRNFLDNKIKGKVPVSRIIPRGSVLMFAQFTGEDGSAGLLRPHRGMRLGALPVNSRTVPGSIQPGVIVDIEAPFGVGGKIPKVLTVMERVRVKAVGTRTIDEQREEGGRRRAMRSFRTITIEIEPMEATYLSMIERLAVGEFDLHLRDTADDGYPKTGRPGINPQVLRLLEKALGQALPTARP